MLINLPELFPKFLPSQCGMEMGVGDQALGA